jgi:hypothetical protein
MYFYQFHICLWGSNNVTEETDLKPESEGGRQLVIVEAITMNSRFKTTVLRFGGLIGDDHPYIFRLVVKPRQPQCSLIHQEDCIGIILKIIQTNTWEKPIMPLLFHPSRSVYYPKL